jgi:hypothetical protein
MPNSASVRSGRHLLDHEALSCLLVLLFIDDSRLNTSRLHRVLRNLCYHTATRVWIINTLLSILHHLCEGTASASLEAAAVSSGRSKRKTVDISGAGSPSAEMDSPTASGHSEVPTWLNIYLCAALGSQANVFQLQRACPAVKHKASSAGRLSSVSQTSHRCHKYIHSPTGITSNLQACSRHIDITCQKFSKLVSSSTVHRN